MGSSRLSAALAAACLGFVCGCANPVDLSPEVSGERGELTVEFGTQPPPAPDRGPGDLMSRTGTPLPAAACNNPCAVGRAHSACTDACTSAVTFIDPFCGETFWDEMCVIAAESECQLDCDCTHRLTRVGLAQSAKHCACAGKVCRFDRYCCTTAWDHICVSEAIKECGL